MIITDHFIYIHYNKTGGTFTRAKVSEWGKRYGFAVQNRNGAGWKHAGVSRIPELPDVLQALPVYSGIRNPFDLYVSDYEFKYWKHGASRWLLPRTADYTFSEWMDAIHTFPCRSNIPDEVYEVAAAKNHGYLTMDFALVFATDPAKALSSKRSFKAALNKINWLHTERLNADLAALLNSVQDRSGDFVLGAEPILPVEGGRNSHEWRAYYTDELQAQVRQRDAWLFEVFDEYCGTE